MPAEYPEERPEARFAHPALPAPASAGVPPVFAGEVRHENGAWRVSDPRFRTADAMFLANMLVMPNEGRADPFLPEERLAHLRRQESVMANADTAAVPTTPGLES